MAAGEQVPTPRRRPAGWLIGVLMASLAGLAMFGTMSALLLPNYNLSSYTQHHGIRDSGTISSVTNSRSDRGSWSAVVQITLHRPVDGATSTTFWVGNAVHSPDGTPETVLVDPQDPAHAEYPGRPTDPLSGLVFFLSIAGVTALLVHFADWRLAVIRFRNRGLPRPQPGRHRHPTGTRSW